MKVNRSRNLAVAWRLLPVETAEPTEIDDGEQQVTSLRSDGLRVPPGNGRLEFRHFLVQLVDHRGDIGPVKTSPGRHFLRLLSLQQRRQVARYTVEPGDPFPAGTLVGLDLLPLPHDTVSVVDAGVTENMRVPPNELLADRPRHRLQVEAIGLARYLAVEDNLQQDVTQFVGQMPVVAVVDGVDQFVGFLDEVALECRVVLFEIPGAAVDGTQAGHDLHQLGDPVIDREAGGGCWSVGRFGHLRKQRFRRQ